ncbi:hypothetical protein ABZ372_41695, partial [Streptomyces sp. NPDC005921]
MRGSELRRPSTRAATRRASAWSRCRALTPLCRQTTAPAARARHSSTASAPVSARSRRPARTAARRPWSYDATLAAVLWEHPDR